MRTSSGSSFRDRQRSGATSKAGKGRPPSRQRDIRRRILDILSAGPITGPALLKKGNFSSSTLHVNLRAMKAEGVIVSERHGREQTIRLLGSTVSSPGRTANFPSGDEVQMLLRDSSAIPRNLQEALAAVALRMAPIKQLREKRMVLEQLAQTTPAPIAEILRSIMSDLARLVPVQAGTDD